MCPPPPPRLLVEPQSLQGCSLAGPHPQLRLLQCFADSLVSLSRLEAISAVL